ncbi:MAG: tyrosine-protein phosphatase [Acidimicrobiales bacterium]|nr:tyrosine-protein phosphatase [Acidimicrobiales bacterium]
MHRLAPRLLGGLVAVILVGNLAIAGCSLAVRSASRRPVARVPGVRHVRVVDERVLAGSAPTAEGYRWLAARGVTTVVDLRAEHRPGAVDGLPVELGLRRVHLPVRDGQTPTYEQVRAFLATVRDAAGPVYVHCGAGVGRTGAMTAAYLSATGPRSRCDAVRGSLAVGPPSLEQLVFAATLRPGRAPAPPSTPVLVLSRLIDGPRRLWSRLR